MIMIRLLLFLLILPLAFAGDKIYVMTLDREEFSLNDVYVKMGNAPIQDVRADQIRFELVTESGDILLEGSLPVASSIPPLSSASEEQLERYKITKEDLQKDTAVQEEKSDIVVASSDPKVIFRIPYHPFATALFIYAPDGKTISTDLHAFSDLCGDHACQEQESFESCSIDCLSGGQDGFCDSKEDNICDPDCDTREDKDCDKSKEQLTYERTYVCMEDGFCAIGEDNENCPADCNGSIIPYFIGVFMLILVILVAVSRRKNR